MKETPRPVREAFSGALRDGVFPCASLLVAVEGEIVMRENFGCAPDTIFDIASLTKPVATDALCQALAAEGRLDLQDTVFEDVTVRHLLTHTSGLPAWKPYYEILAREAPQRVGTRQARGWYEQKIRAESRAATGGARVYSDLGFILLGFFLEDRSGKTLDTLFDEKISGPLGMASTLFRPPLPPSRFAPTSDAPGAWRKGILQGVVHDDNAFALGGVAGHAGLFSTADDLHRFLQHARKARPPALGWDAPSANSQAGRYFSPGSLGHLGYTGCSFWWDPAKDFHIILLSNRTFPSADNEAIKTFRPMIHDLIVDEIGLMSPAVAPRQNRGA